MPLIFKFTPSSSSSSNCYLLVRAVVDSHLANQGPNPSLWQVASKTAIGKYCCFFLLLCGLRRYCA